MAHPTIIHLLDIHTLSNNNRLFSIYNSTKFYGFKTFVTGDYTLKSFHLTSIISLAVAAWDLSDKITWIGWIFPLLYWISSQFWSTKYFVTSYGDFDCAANNKALPRFQVKFLKRINSMLTSMLMRDIGDKIYKWC